MRKIFIGIVCGLGAIIDADASIISRSFLDEALTNYATSTALDLKADKTDLTTLSEIVGTPAELTYNAIIEADNTGLLFDDIFDTKDTLYPTNDLSEFIRLSYSDINFPGLAGVVYRLFNSTDEDYWPVKLAEIFDDYARVYFETGQSSLMDILISGVTFGNSVFYGLPKLTEEVDKIGAVPDGYTNLADALMAVKITADAAKELAEKAIPNVLNESGNGKYVLTAEKIGDTATYNWEIIDRAINEITAK